jgi:type I restriction enzyme M protein
MVFRARKKPDRKQRVLIVDASSLFKKGRNQNTLEPEHIEQIFARYRGYSDVAGAARVVTLDEIAKNDWNLNISRYVESVTEEKTLTVEEATANLKQALKEAYASEDRLAQLLKDAGLMQ